MGKVKADNFIDIPFTSHNLDRYIVRTSVLKALRQSLPKLSGRLLDAGCGKMPYREFILANSAVSEYVGLDIEDAKVYDECIRPDYTWDGTSMPFEDASFDCAFATEVLEHCPEPEIFLREIHRILKPDGFFFFTVPFLWNLHEVPHDEYRYTPFSLQRHLKNCSFSGTQIQSLGGWHASMAQMLGLWVRRSPMNGVTRGVLSRLLKPFIGYLLRKDVTHNGTFKEGTMITGLYGCTYKGAV